MRPLSCHAPSRTRRARHTHSREYLNVAREEEKEEEKKIVSWSADHTCSWYGCDAGVETEQRVIYINGSVLGEKLMMQYYKD